MSDKKSHLTIIDDAAPSYLAQVEDAREVASIIKENVGNITAADLDRVRAPGAGGLAWEIQTLEGAELAQELVGVIVEQREVRAYWASEYEGGGTPPTCASPDGDVGYGEPGGVCATCPMAVFGTARDGKGKGQACRLMRLLFILRPGSLLPMVLVVPPSSLRAVKQYMFRLANEATKYSTVVTSFTLAKAKNDGGVVYSSIVPALKERLSEGDALRVAQYREALLPVFRQARVDAVDAEAH